MTKKISIILAMAIMFAASAASAEVRTLPTDTLKSGQVEAQVQYQHHDTRIESSLGTFKQKTELVDTALGFGITDRLKLYGGVPFYVNVRAEMNGSSATTNGIGDSFVGIRYRILDQDCDFMGMSVGVESMLNTGARRLSSDSYIVAPYAAISKKFHRFVPYGLFAGEYATKDESATFVVAGGFQYRFPRVVLDARGTGIFFGGGTNSTTPSRTWNLDIRSHIRLVDGIYLVPDVGMSVTSSSTDKVDPTVRYDSATNYNAGIGLYFLY